MIEKAMETHKIVESPNVEAILETEVWTYEFLRREFNIRKQG